MFVLFDDQSRNLTSITPYEVEFRLIMPGHPPTVPFASHVTDLLAYQASRSGSSHRPLRLFCRPP